MLFFVGCRTTTENSYTLTPDIPIYGMSGNVNVDMVNLVARDLQWRIKANADRYIVGEITKEEYQANHEYLTSILDRFY